MKLLSSMAHFNHLWNTFIYYRVFQTSRGIVKRLKFAPGKGNMRMLVLFNDGVEVWETAEVSSTLRNNKNSWMLNYNPPQKYMRQLYFSISDSLKTIVQCIKSVNCSIKTLSPHSQCCCWWKNHWMSADHLCSPNTIHNNIENGGRGFLSHYFCSPVNPGRHSVMPT